MVRQVVSLCGGEALEPQLQPIAGSAVAAPQGGYPAIGSGERLRGTSPGIRSRSAGVSEGKVVMEC